MNRKAQTASYGDSPAYGTINADPVVSHELTPCPASAIANDRSPFVLNKVQYAHFEECMTNPTAPTEMMVQAHAAILAIKKK